MLPAPIIQKREDTQQIERQKAKLLLQDQSESLEEINKNTKMYIDVQNIEEIINGRIICFDLETTGFAIDDCIIEIGAVELIDGYRTGALFQSYVKPQKKNSF